MLPRPVHPPASPVARRIAPRRPARPRWPAGMRVCMPVIEPADTNRRTNANRPACRPSLDRRGGPDKTMARSGPGPPAPLRSTVNLDLARAAAEAGAHGLGLAGNEAFALRPLAGQLAGPANRLCPLPRLLFRWLFVVAAKLHLAEDALALHLLLERLEGLIDIIVPDENLHASFLLDRILESVWPANSIRARRACAAAKRSHVAEYDVKVHRGAPRRRHGAVGGRAPGASAARERRAKREAPGRKLQSGGVGQDPGHMAHLTA